MHPDFIERPRLIVCNFPSYAMSRDPSPLIPELAVGELTMTMFSYRSVPQPTFYARNFFYVFLEPKPEINLRRGHSYATLTRSLVAATHGCLRRNNAIATSLSIRRDSFAPMR